MYINILLRPKTDLQSYISIFKFALFFFFSNIRKKSDIYLLFLEFIEKAGLLLILSFVVNLISLYFLLFRIVLPNTEIFKNLWLSFSKSFNALLRRLLFKLIHFSIQFYDSVYFL